VWFAVSHEDNATEDNVDRGGEERGRYEEEKRLNDIRSEFPLIRVRQRATNIADKLNCRNICVSRFQAA
jgi:hypothetical protein